MPSRRDNQQGGGFTNRTVSPGDWMDRSRKTGTGFIFVRGALCRSFGFSENRLLGFIMAEVNLFVKKELYFV